MNDEATNTGSPARPTTRRVATPEAAAEPAAPKMAPYVVKGADIWTTRGRHKEGTTVDLTAAEARHFTKRGLLAPFIPGEDLEG